jgi:hypothetical protein
VSQSHFTIRFPLKSNVDAKELEGRMSSMTPTFFQSIDTIGTIHYSRFTVLSEKTLLFLGDFDGEFTQLMNDLATSTGPFFETIFEDVEASPPLPVAAHAADFVEWMADHLMQPLTVYSAYPGATVKEIKTLAEAAGVSGGGKQQPFLVILPCRSRLAFIEIQVLLRAMSRKVQKDLDTVGTPHFAQFLPLEDSQVGFFTVYDGSFDTYIADFTANIGSVFDLIFKFTKDPPPSPCRKHLQEFIDFAAAASRTPIGYYQAYPGLTVQDIHALIADGRSE